MVKGSVIMPFIKVSASAIRIGYKESFIEAATFIKILKNYLWAAGSEESITNPWTKFQKGVYAYVACQYKSHAHIYFFNLKNI